MSNGLVPGTIDIDNEQQKKAFSVVGVGSSAGGLEAFTQLLTHLDDDTGMAFVLIQHLDPLHDSRLTDLLVKATSMPLVEVTEGMTVCPNHVYVIPKNTNLAIDGNLLRLTPRDPKHLHLPIDHFFRSLASGRLSDERRQEDDRSEEAQSDKRPPEERPGQAIGIVLSGTGSDGTLGLQEIKAGGGITFAQDPSSAKFPGMPLSAVAIGSVDYVMSPEKIAGELARIAKYSSSRPALSLNSAEPNLSQRNSIETAENKQGVLSEDDDELIRKVIMMLRNTAGVDFTHYRDSTIKRRIMRRMTLHNRHSLAEYVELIESEPGEVQTLFHEILINVTSFFRDPEIFETLKSDVFPRIIQDKPIDRPIRIWSAGCSTGQEAYSLAMVLLEFFDDNPVRPPIQIFATDLSHDISLSAARAGVYPQSIEAEVSPERLRRFFAKEEGKYRVIKSIRDLCVFAKQNIVADPPFSRVDLISCRNVLIYLSPALQKRVIPTFHYALNPNGVLVLGNAESIGSFTDLFEPLHCAHRIYSKKTGVFRQYPYFKADEYVMTKPSDDKTVAIKNANPVDFQREADRIVLGQYAPPSVLVNESLEILQFRGRTSPYLEPAAGTASLKLLKMLRDGLFVEIKQALAEAKQKNAPVGRSGVQLRDGENTRNISLRVSPVKLPGRGECCYLVLFEEIDTHTRSRSTRQSSAASSGGMMAFLGAFLRRPKLFTSSSNPDSGERERNELHRELAATREQSQATAEQHDAAIEELKSANEEILSSNEELQSTNEEMETAKEELQSINEELTTVNEQLQTRNLELNLLTNDLTNLLASAGVPLVVLSSDLRVRRFSPAAGKTLNLTADTLGRPVSDVKLGIEVTNLESLLDEVQSTVQVIEQEIQDSDGHWYGVRLHPYRTADNRIDGAVLVFSDIHAVKMSQLRLQVANDFNDAIVQTLREPFLVLTSDLRVKSANQAFFKAFQVTQQETEQRLIYELGSGQWDQPSLRTLLTEVLTTEAGFDNYEVKFDFPDIGARVMSLNARRLIQVDGEAELILLALQDITDRVKRQDDLIEISRNKDNFLSMLGHELRNPLSSVVSGLEALSTHELDESDERELFDMIGRQATLMTRLVDDLLDMSRISAGKIKLQKKRFDLVNLVSHVIGDHRHHVESNQLTLTSELPPSPLWIVGDEARLSQVLKNLLNNATKFTDPGGSIQVKLESGEDTSHQNQATIRVQDNGIGMEPATVETMFQEFRQAESSIARSRGGLGLGMALSRRLVTMHGGKISASSDGLGHGSCFTLELALCKDQTAAPESTKPAEPMELKSHRILIVDDQRALRLPMKHLLKALGQEVVEACDGTTALETAVQYRPEIILCDIGLPDIDGYAVARAIRANTEFSGVFLVAVTGYGQDADRELAHEAGFDRHITKPIGIDALRDVIQQASTRIV